MHLIKILLPLRDNEQQKFPAHYFEKVRDDLTERFGGVTAFSRSPAIGLWKETDEDIRRDDVVIFEVIAEQLEEEWWTEYRRGLQNQFRQDELLIWATNITKL